MHFGDDSDVFSDGQTSELVAMGRPIRGFHRGASEGLLAECYPDLNHADFGQFGQLTVQPLRQVWPKNT